MARYEEGLKAYRQCNQTLTEAEKIVDVLTRDADGTLKAEAFGEEEDQESEEEEEEEEDEGGSLF